jgi:chemotaxis signal transduction protein
MAGRALELRRAFDRAFAEPPVEAGSATESLLAFKAGGDAYAVRLAEIGGLFADLTLVRLPSPVPEFLGVVGLRHDVVPVYSLGRLLGNENGGDTPRWVIAVRASHPVAFAFEEFEGYLRVPTSALLAAGPGVVSSQVPTTVRLADGARGVVSIGSLLETIEQRIRHLFPTKEQ